MKELLSNPWILQIAGWLVCLLITSQFLKKTGDKVGDTIEKVAGEKARDISYEFLHGFAEGLKREHYKGDENLISNDQIDKNLNKYKLSVGLEGSGSKARE